MMNTYIFIKSMCYSHSCVQVIRKSFFKSSMNLSLLAETFYQYKNTIAQWCHGVLVYILPVPLAILIPRSVTKTNY